MKSQLQVLSLETYVSAGDGSYVNWNMIFRFLIDIRYVFTCYPCYVKVFTMDSIVLLAFDVGPTTCRSFT
ncbi:unnamed protein product [Cylicocyclus nassatus]|uniref:Uncharacterized protein n=1 Tax=Cylicocyclus nassatus TaxID=53992 RepID=A0AA36GVM2_CYLNA|nr:unnamed protein product [Cylicocyclus nassatus]